MKRDTIAKIIIDEIQSRTGYTNVKESNTFDTINHDFHDLLILLIAVEAQTPINWDDEEPIAIAESFTKEKDWAINKTVEQFINHINSFL